MNVLYISKNIPLPDFKESKVIIEQKKLFDEDEIDIDLIYPKEFTPKFLAFLGGRFFANSRIKGSFHVDGVDVTVFQYFRLPFIKAIEWILCFILTSKIKFNHDLIHAHYVFPDGIIAYRLSKKHNVPFIVTVRNGDLIHVKKSIINKFIFNFVLKRAHKVIALTSTLENTLLNIVPKEKITIIPNFINDDFYHVEKTEHADLVSSKIQLITIANLIPRKNVNWLVEYASNNITSVDLVICGDGELMTKLKHIATENVCFKGRMEKISIINELDKSDVFALPSFNETFGLVYAEAAARNNIVIGLACTGLDGIKNDGFYFVKDKNAFFNCLDQLLSIEKKELQRQQKQAFLHSTLFKRINVKTKLNDLYWSFYK